jgi:hypothetical protein
VNGASDCVIEVLDCPRSLEFDRIEKIRVLGKLSSCLLPKASEEVSIVHSGEPSLEFLAAHFEVKRNGYRGRRSRLRWDVRPAFPQPLEQDVTPERHTSEEQQVRWRPVDQHLDDKAQIRSFAGVVHPRRGVQLRTASPKDENGGIPAAALRLRDESWHVMGALGSFEPVKDEYSRPIRSQVVVMQEEMVAVGCLNALRSQSGQPAATKKLGPQRLRMRSW